MYNKTKKADATQMYNSTTHPDQVSYLGKVVNETIYENEILKKIKCNIALEEKNLVEKRYSVEYAFWWIDVNGKLCETRPEKTATSFISIKICDNNSGNHNTIEYNIPVLHLRRTINVKKQYQKIINGINNILVNGYEDEYMECQKAKKAFDGKLALRRRLILIFASLICLADAVIIFLIYIL